MHNANCFLPSLLVCLLSASFTFGQQVTLDVSEYDRLRDVEKAYQKMQRDSQAMAGRLSDLEGQVGRLPALEAQAQTLGSERDSLAKALGEAERKVTAAMADATDAKSKQADLERKLGEAEAKSKEHARFEKDLRSAEKERDKYKKEAEANKAAKKANEALTKANETLTKANETLKKQVEELEQALKAELERAQQEAEALRKNLAEVGQEKESCQSRTKQLEDSLSLAKRDYSAAAQERDQYKKDVQTYAEMAKQALKGLQEEADKLLRERLPSKSTLPELEALAGRLAGLKRVADLQGQVNTLEGQLELFRKAAKAIDEASGAIEQPYEQKRVADAQRALSQARLPGNAHFDKERQQLDRLLAAYCACTKEAYAYVDFIKDDSRITASSFDEFVSYVYKAKSLNIYQSYPYIKREVDRLRANPESARTNPFVNPNSCP